MHLLGNFNSFCFSTQRLLATPPVLHIVPVLFIHRSITIIVKGLVYLTEVSPTAVCRASAANPKRLTVIILTLINTIRQQTNNIKCW